jgi:uncharacterized protein (TIRG00374 family)
MNRRLQFWIGIAVSVLCIAIVLWLVDLGELVDTIRAADLRVVLLIAAAQVAFMMLRAVRWRVMLLVKSSRIHYWPLLHAQNIGYLVTNLFPFRLGELARSYIAGSDPENDLSLAQALSSVVLERMLDVLVIVLLFAAAIPFAPSLPAEMRTAGMLLGIVAASGFVVILVAAIYHQRTLGLVRWLLARVKRLDDEVWLARADSFLDGFGALTRWQLLLPVLGLSALIWGIIVLAYYGGLRGFWPDASLAAALFALCAAGFGISAPSSPGFVGVFHGAIVLGLSVFPVSTERALAFALVYHAVMYVIIIVLGLLSLSQSGQSLGTIVASVRNLRRA